MKAVVHTPNCQGCIRCIEACPRDAILIRNNVAVINEEECDGCGRCVDVCRFKAVYLQ